MNAPAMSENPEIFAVSPLESVCTDLFRNFSGYKSVYSDRRYNIMISEQKDRT